ncbi:hypothetical protein, conserved [Trypanosoma brucei gambiense DAL972]|uniref:ER membrane protein complex subunit 10 n=1 Tax=Trypanosoma brucei gambiense (strain MHOM/CI/86/DAL972) TaxID=679716 RepID=C9ZHW3_TRYB9|nr:hypothetical protein, conserved [Trypanosoma brucei gambiense DAL972]CBH08834.1 hypothetical protein, conserved [Trypanosoma brucei gambiense DAL972]|eukprot:XP_011771275.1 hypothetical protein, conserved [Trypanosoma brucei gambiense DAL972]
MLGLKAIVSFVVLCFASAEYCCGITQSYILQRRIDGTNDWRIVSTFNISRHSVDSLVKLKHSSPQGDNDLTAVEKDALVKAEHVFYRVTRGGDDTDAGAVAVALSPCTIVRGFEALDPRTVLLHETLAVAVGTNVSAVGLQVTSTTNAFHAKMLDGDECDLTVLSLFPQVKIRLKLGLLVASAPLTTPNYTELAEYTNHLSKEGSSQKKGTKKSKKRSSDAQNPLSQEQEQDDAEDEEDKRSFVERYWIYFVVPFAVSLLQGIFAPKQ